ncbi:MAG: 50S ribosomal protein L4 [Myxococcales bacterium]|jgi:large subunit ribosomal protein L4|nr:50S ribosomal protein L4 [Myxococcales bacterium]
MAKFDVLNLQGKKVSEIELADDVFAAEVKEHVLWEVVKQQLASRRAGTHCTLRRGEVRGGGKKPYRQKGTGNARQGSTRAPNYVGGAKVFAPKPRDYSYSVPKKVREAALRSALTVRANEQKLVILEDFALQDAKTKQAVSVLNGLGTPAALVVGSADTANASKAMRNLEAAKFLPVEGLNTYDILNYPSLVLTVKTAKTIEARLSATAQTPGGAP